MTAAAAAATAGAPPLAGGVARTTAAAASGAWTLALPLGFAYAAFFVEPLLMLVAVSFFADEA